MFFFVVHRASGRNLTVYNFKGFGILGAGFIIHKRVGEFAPTIFVIGNYIANGFANWNILMNFKYVFIFFISRLVVHVVDLDFYICKGRKRRVFAVGGNNTDRILVFGFEVKVAFHIDSTSVIVDSKHLVIISRHVGSRKGISRLLASIVIFAIIIIGSNHTHRSSIWGFFVHCQFWNIVEYRSFVDISNSYRYSNSLVALQNISQLSRSIYGELGSTPQESEGAQHTDESETMVAMQMSYEDSTNLREAQTRTAQLYLCAFATVEKEQLATNLYHLCRGKML